MEEIKRLQRLGAWQILPDRYADLRRRLVALVSSSADLTDDQRQTFQGAVGKFADLEKRIERSIATGTNPPNPAKFNDIVSSQIDELQAVLLTIQHNLGDKNMSDQEALAKALALVQRLHARTREGKVDWEDTGDEREFKVTVDQFALRLRQVFDPEFPPEPDYALVVVEEISNRTIDRITNQTLRPMMDTLTEEGLNPYRLMELTFEMARRKALGVDNALDTILKGLADE